MNLSSATRTAPRLHRSVLPVLLGSEDRCFDEAAGSAADVVVLGCAQAGCGEHKERARRRIMEALNDIDWGDKTLVLRVSGVGKSDIYRDAIDFIEACPRLDRILIPGVVVAGDVYAVDELVTQVEVMLQRGKRVGLEATIETAAAAANIDTIARSSRRLAALSFGLNGDAASARAHALATCRTVGLRAIDGTYVDADGEGSFLAGVLRAAVQGYSGKWVSHVSQIKIVNQTFASPAAATPEAMQPDAGRFRYYPPERQS